MAQTALTTRPDTVVVRNVYWLMAYAFHALDIADYRMLASEEFGGAEDLLAAILLVGVETQRRRGFERGYQAVAEDGWRVKGRVDLRRTMALENAGDVKAAYAYDEYTEDTTLNRILKTCVASLMRNGRVSPDRRRRLRGSLAWFGSVGIIADPSLIRWGDIRYHRNNRRYELLINVCYLVVRGMLLSSEQGDTKAALLDDEQRFSALYEHFLLEYYRRHYPQLGASAERVRQQDKLPKFVPTMLTDVTLRHGGRTLILDAKCYGKILSMSYGREILSAEHVRQIFYYACHTGTPGDTAAMLVYAGTGEKNTPETWVDQGYQLGCQILDLSRDFSTVSATLDGMTQSFFGPLEKCGTLDNATAFY